MNLLRRSTVGFPRATQTHPLPDVQTMISTNPCQRICSQRRNSRKRSSTTISSRWILVNTRLTSSSSDSSSHTTKVPDRTNTLFRNSQAAPLRCIMIFYRFLHVALERIRRISLGRRSMTSGCCGRGLIRVCGLEKLMRMWVCRF